jgi:hypothetical protein
MSDWREIMGAPAVEALVKPTHNPQHRPTKPTSADIAYENQTGCSEASRLAVGAGVRVELPADATPESLIDVCRHYGVGLRIDPDGTVVVESYGKAWHALVGAVAAHVDEIASILLTTGDGRQFSARRCDA